MPHTTIVKWWQSERDALVAAVGQRDARIATPDADALAGKWPPLVESVTGDACQNENR